MAFVLGTLIGAERQYRLRSAGLHTNLLVAVGAAAFVDLAMHLTAVDAAAGLRDLVVADLQQRSGVRHASWESSTKD